MGFDGGGEGKNEGWEEEGEEELRDGKIGRRGQIEGEKDRS